ncbi:MAG: carbohydrate ABC transporter permease [Christensenellales bacterium]
MNRATSWHQKLLAFLALGIGTLLFLYPFWWMLVNSLNTAGEVFGPPALLPKSWRWRNYIDIFAVQPFGRHILNTLFVAVTATSGNVLVSSLSGYAFARLRFPGRNFLFVLLLTALMMPIEVIIVPLFFQMKSWGLSDSLYPLVLVPMFGAQGAFSAFMFRQFFVTVPSELEEAARMDGLGYAGIFLHIMLPIAKPVLSSAAILAFLATWNTYLEPLVFTTSLQQYTLPLSLSNFNDTYGEPQWHLQMAATTLSVVPIMMVYLFFQEKVRDAMVNSGVKG